MALDTGFFYGDLTIAQLETLVVAKEVNTSIVKYEETFLRLLLGDSLYDAYIAGMAVALPDRLAKWTALDNKIYIIKNVGQPTEFKMSPVANYVYFLYMRNLATQTTGTGEKVIKAENAVSVSGAVKNKLAWNAMVRMNFDIVRFIKANSSDYPEYAEPVYDSSTPESIQLYKDRKDILKTIILYF